MTTLKLNLVNIFNSYCLICLSVYPPSVVLAKLIALGAYISSNLAAIYKHVTPINCNSYSSNPGSDKRYLSV